MGNRQNCAKFQENLFRSNEIISIFCPPLFRKRPIFIYSFIYYEGKDDVEICFLVVPYWWVEVTFLMSCSKLKIMNDSVDMKSMSPPVYFNEIILKFSGTFTSNRSKGGSSDAVHLCKKIAIIQNVLFPFVIYMSYRLHVSLLRTVDSCYFEVEGSPESLRGIRTSRYQFFRIEENTIRTTKFHK